MGINYNYDNSYSWDQPVWIYVQSHNLANATPRGRVAAELVDADTLEPLAAHAISLRTDSLNAVLVEGAPATAIARLRLTLEDASLFSFWMELK